MNSYRSFHIVIGRTAIRDYSRSPLIFVCENFGQEVISRTSVPFGMNVNKTQCRICKRLAGHISPPFLVSFGQIFVGLKRDVLALFSFACPLWCGLSAKRGLVWL